MPHHLRQTDNNRWSIFNDQDAAQYSGTLAQCQDWMDSREASKQRTFFEMFVAWLSRRTPRPRGEFSVRRTPEQPVRG